MIGKLVWVSCVTSLHSPALESGPPADGPLVALRRVYTRAGGRGAIIRSGKDARGSYLALFAEHVDADSHHSIVELSRGYGEPGAFVGADYTQQLEEALRMVSADKLGAWCASRLERMGGLQVADRSSVYMLPPRSFDALAAFRETMREHYGACSVHVIEVQSGADAIDAFRATIERVYTARASELDAETGELGERALSRRVEEADGWLSELASYETLLGTTLEAVRAQVERTRNVTAIARIAASGV
jgi:hypothetical protein